MRDDERVEREMLHKYVHWLYQEGSMLFVGARSERCYHAAEFKQSGRVMTLLEIWPPEVDYFTQHLGKPFTQVRWGDVRYVDTGERFDVVCWFDGPEHIQADELSATLERLERIGPVVLLAPWGKYPQGAYGGNPYNEHKATVYPEMLQSLGYTVQVAGWKDTPWGRILGWKHE